MKTPIRILGIAGSLRRGSYNRAALRAATELVPEGAILETFELDGIPVFNQDEEQNPPAKVTEFKSRIREADAILFVTPEYNYSVSGVLKNARSEEHTSELQSHSDLVCRLLLEKKKKKKKKKYNKINNK